jgi:hypothetical protein
MFGSYSKLSGIPQPGLQAPGLPAGAVFIGTLSWLRLLCQGPKCVPAAKFMVDHASTNFYAWNRLMLISWAVIIR